jgi:deoxyribodipyrimidine photo-lyase
MGGGRSIIWFRRDLRVHDHPALQHAGRDDREVLPVFVIDPALVKPSGAVRLAFMYRSLRSLDESLGGRLVIRHGDPATVLPAIAAEVEADEVVVSRDYGPYGRARDTAVRDRLRLFDIEFVGRGSPYAIAPGTVVKGDGNPYSVFTPFYRAWWAGAARALVAETEIRWCATNVSSDGVPADPPIECDLPEASEDAAHRRWEVFVERDVDRYADRRNDPADDGTSRMSPYLRWGQVHPCQLLADLGESAGEDTFRKELAWREFYADVLYHHPSSARENLQAKMDLVAQDTDANARGRFQRWAQGRTGYPIVDAGMRELRATGWMHNRVRMITASFLVKDLHLPWQWGARHFMRHLVDGDLASNQHGWQWTAGTGTDAAPYFRVFNPTLQSAKFDPTGAYIRKWVPERGDAVGTAIHQPVDPMVDHAVERAEALQRYGAVSGR